MWSGDALISVSGDGILLGDGSGYDSVYEKGGRQMNRVMWDFDIHNDAGVMMALPVDVTYRRRRR